LYSTLVDAMLANIISIKLSVIDDMRPTFFHFRLTLGLPKN
jgi:hypothetical protein